MYWRRTCICLKFVHPKLQRVLHIFNTHTNDNIMWSLMHENTVSTLVLFVCFCTLYSVYKAAEEQRGIILFLTQR